MEENIILFPKMRIKLEQQIEADMHDGLFESAMENIYILLGHHHQSYALNIQALICLIKLKQYEDAEVFCEGLLDNQEKEHYFDYLDYYIMILYEATKFHKVIQTIQEEEDLQSIPEGFKSKFTEIKRLAIQMNEWAAMEIVNDIHTGIAEKDFKKQYYLLQKWKQHQVKTPESLYSLLIEEMVHPVIKTVILMKLVDEQVDKTVQIKKWNQAMTIIPKSLGNIEDFPVYQKTLGKLKDMEQDNPTLYLMIKEMYDHYCFVMFPFLYEESDVDIIAESITTLIKQQLGEVIYTEHNPVMEQIELCDQLYQDLMLQ